MIYKYIYVFALYYYPLNIIYELQSLYSFKYIHKGFGSACVSRQKILEYIRCLCGVCYRIIGIMCLFVLLWSYRSFMFLDSTISVNTYVLKQHISLLIAHALDKIEFFFCRYATKF
jgi:hypothetical protein